MLTTVVRGTQVDAETRFQNPDGTPLVVATPVTYAVLDYNRELVYSGIASQDNVDPSHWTTSFAVPVTAPVDLTGLGKYTLVWYATTGNGAISSNSEYFSVVAEGAPLPIRDDVVLLESSSLQDTLILPFPVDAGSGITLTIYTENNAALFVDATTLAANLTPRIVNGLYYYDYVGPGPMALFGMTAGGQGQSGYQIFWSYTQNGVVNTEIHRLFVINAKMMAFVGTVRQSLQLSNYYTNTSPEQAWTLTELVAFVLRGFQTFNAHPPQTTIWTVASLPMNLMDAITKCALREALQAWYLAEGLKAFEFTGQSTQLTVDRTPYIENQIQAIQSWIDNNLQKIKKISARSQSAGQLSINVGVGTNFPMPTTSRLFQLYGLGAGTIPVL